MDAVARQLEDDGAADARGAARDDGAGTAQLIIGADDLGLGLFCDFGEELLDGLVGDLRACGAVPPAERQRTLRVGGVRRDGHGAGECPVSALSVKHQGPA